MSDANQRATRTVDAQAIHAELTGLHKQIQNTKTALYHVETHIRYLEEAMI